MAIGPKIGQEIANSVRTLADAPCSFTASGPQSSLARISPLRPAR
jgi:hypothetical protein